MAADSKHEPAPKRIGRRDLAVLTFEWQDGSIARVPAASIRRGCPCAHCVDEHSGRPILDPDSVPQTLEQREVALVGNYAIGITFSDGHRTGIFTWSALRRIAAPFGEPR